MRYSEDVHVMQCGQIQTLSDDITAKSTLCFKPAHFVTVQHLGILLHSQQRELFFENLFSFGK